MKNLADFEKNLLVNFGIKRDSGRMDIFKHLLGEYHFNFEDKTFAELFNMMNSNNINLEDGNRRINIIKEKDDNFDNTSIFRINIYDIGQGGNILRKSLIVQDNCKASINTSTMYIISKLFELTINDDGSTIYTEALNSGSFGEYKVVSKYYNTDTLEFLEDKKYDIITYSFLDNLGIYCDNQIKASSGRSYLLQNIDNNEKGVKDQLTLKKEG